MFSQISCHNFVQLSFVTQISTGIGQFPKEKFDKREFSNIIQDPIAIILNYSFQFVLYIFLIVYTFILIVSQLRVYTFIHRCLLLPLVYLLSTAACQSEDVSDVCKIYGNMWPPKPEIYGCRRTFRRVT